VVDASWMEGFVDAVVKSSPGVWFVINLVRARARQGVWVVRVLVALCCSLLYVTVVVGGAAVGHGRVFGRSSASSLSS